MKFAFSETPKTGFLATRPIYNWPLNLDINKSILLLLDILRILGECLLISSLPGKALRMLVDIARLAKLFNMRSQSRAW